MQGGSLYHFYDGFWYDPPRMQTMTLWEADTLTIKQTRHGYIIMMDGFVKAFNDSII